MQQLTPYIQDSVTVGTSSILVLQNNPVRTGLVIVNLSANNVSIGLGVDAVAGAGITLAPNGVWEMDCWTAFLGQIHAVASAVGSVISIQEFA